jgi:hypothetical protein
VVLEVWEGTVTGPELALAVQNFVAPRLTGRRWKTAVLVGTKLQFGMARQYGVYSEAYGTDQIFEDREQALAWLLAA